MCADSSEKGKGEFGFPFLASWPFFAKTAASVFLSFSPFSG